MGLAPGLALPPPQGRLCRLQRRLAEARRAKIRYRASWASGRLRRLKQQARRAAAPRPRADPGRDRNRQGAAGACIHNASQRADKAFVAVNIAAIPHLLESGSSVPRPAPYRPTKGRDGKFKLADGGTVPRRNRRHVRALQAKLLRVLQEGEFEARFQPIAATMPHRRCHQRDLEAEIEAGRFRTDLYYRLNVVTSRCRRCASDSPTCVAVRAYARNTATTRPAVA